MGVYYNKHFTHITLFKYHHKLCVRFYHILFISETKRGSQRLGSLLKIT